MLESQVSSIMTNMLCVLVYGNEMVILYVMSHKYLQAIHMALLVTVDIPHKPLNVIIQCGTQQLASNSTNYAANNSKYMPQ